MLFFFNDTATTEIYTLSLHDALPILPLARARTAALAEPGARVGLAELAYRRLDGTPFPVEVAAAKVLRSEEHTSELQSRQYLVCRLLLEKKKLIISSLYYINTLWSAI